MVIGEVTDAQAGSKEMKKSEFSVFGGCVSQVRLEEDHRANMLPRFRPRGGRWEKMVDISNSNSNLSMPDSFQISNLVTMVKRIRTFGCNLMGL